MGIGIAAVADATLGDVLLLQVGHMVHQVHGKMQLPGSAGDGLQEVIRLFRDGPAHCPRHTNDDYHTR